MKNSESIEIQMRNDKAARGIEGYLVKKDPDYLREFHRHWSEITERNVQFWRDREAERV